jgi:membrane-associated protease RseP (regulator of RpoE activity)
MQALYGILLLTVIVIIHELGHAVACLLIGVKVNKFQVFFGRSLYSFKNKYLTEVGIGWFPLGGYILPDEKGLKEKSAIKRIFMCSAGVLANLISVAVVYLFMGKGLYVSVVVPFVSALYVFFGFPYIVYTLIFSKVAVKASDLGGPVMVVQMLKGWGGFAFISWNIAVMNIMPLLPLDGGHIFAEIVKKIIPEKYSKPMLAVYQYVGIVLIFLLMAFCVGLDISRLIK